MDKTGSFFLNPRPQTSSRNLTRLDQITHFYVLSVFQDLTPCCFLPPLPFCKQSGWGTGVLVPGRNRELFRVFAHCMCHSGCWRDWSSCWIKIKLDRILHFVPERVVAPPSGGTQRVNLFPNRWIGKRKKMSRVTAWFRVGRISAVLAHVHPDMPHDTSGPLMFAKLWGEKLNSAFQFGVPALGKNGIMCLSGRSTHE